MSDRLPHEAPPSEMPVGRAPWRSFVFIGSGFGASMWAIVTRWAEIEPVLESPATIVISMLLIFGLGAFSAYWVLARPHEERLVRAEAVIKGLRERERDLLIRDGEKSAAIARLETSVDYLRSQVEEQHRQQAELRKALETLQRPPRRRGQAKPSGQG